LPDFPIEAAFLLIAAVVMLSMGIVIRFFFTKKQDHHIDISITYSVVLSFFFGLLLIGIAHSFFLLYKLSTYFPYLALVAIFLLASEVFISKLKKSLRVMFVSLLIPIYVASYLYVLPIQIDTYEQLISSRESSITEQLIKAREFISNSKSGSTVYAYITDPESQLLTRAVFRKNLWEPLVSIDYDFKDEIVPAPKLNSQFDWILVRKNIECQLVDFKSNESVFSNGNLHLYSSRASLVEFGSGMRYGYRDSVRGAKCPGNRFEVRIIAQVGVFKFINGLKADVIYLRFEKNSSQKCEEISIKSGNTVFTSLKADKLNTCMASIRLPDPQANYVSSYEVLNSSNQEISLVAVSWKKAI
jgi:hypothetical protein